MKHYIIVVFLCYIPFVIYSEIRGRVVDSQGNALAGINIFWQETTKGAVSDTNGEFQITRVDNSENLIFSGVSFQRDTVNIRSVNLPLIVVLRESILLSEVTVTRRTPGVVRPRFSALQTEKITTEELSKAACCNLSESFETNPSVDVVYSDAATGAKQIKLLGLPGTYVQMLTENIPNLRGISSAFGLGFIPGPWMEGIQVSKGTGSVINGYEAITGQINVDFKKPPTSEIVFANLFANDAGRVEANVNASVRLTPELSTGILFHASDELLSLDADNDGYMDMPMVSQINVANRWYYRSKNFVSQAFVKALSENRMGGTLDQSYMIDIQTERYELFLKNGYVLNPASETSMGLILSGTYHQQDAHYGMKHYDGIQQNLYANFIFQTNLTPLHKLVAGMSFNYDDYDEVLHFKNPSHTNTTTLTFPVTEYVSGVFGEYTFNLNNKLILLAGLRADVHNLYGMFLTPRFHAQFSPDPHWSFRGTIGKGRRSPRVLAENNFYLASNRALHIDNDLRMEEAWNTGLSAQHLLHVFGRNISLSAEWYYTNFENQVVVDTDTDVHSVFFRNLEGQSYAHSLQFEAHLDLLDGLTLTLAQRFTDVKTTIAGQLREKPLTNRYRGLATMSYQTPLKKWQFDLTAQFNGGGRMPDPHPLNPKWDREFPAYTFILGQVTRYFRTWSVYAGTENLTNFIQPNPIIDIANPHGPYFDATNVWGPTHGRKLYIGFRWSIDRT